MFSKWKNLFNRKYSLKKFLSPCTYENIFFRISPIRTIRKLTPDETRKYLRKFVRRAECVLTNMCSIFVLFVCNIRKYSSRTRTQYFPLSFVAVFYYYIHTRLQMYKILRVGERGKDETLKRRRKIFA